MKDCKLLVVHDDDDLRNALVELLTSEGFPVEDVTNGHAALEKMKAGYKPDVILSDLLMPVMDGYELNRRLKRHQSWSSIPLIVFTGLNLDAGRLTDVEAILQLPFDSETLLAQVKSACAKAAS
jgi:CheY-like chemotaxis protein